jgi:IS30 family transposase
MSQHKMAKQLHVSQSTISRKLLRNTGRRGYRIQQAETATDTRLLATCKAIKMTTRLIMLIESKISKKWSPEQVSGRLRKEKSIAINYATRYRHMWSDKQCGGHLFQHLRRKDKAYQSPSKDKQAGRGFIKNRISIDERPQVVNNKSIRGDWDIALVIGKGHSGALVTIVERKTRFTVSSRVDDTSAKTVTATTIALFAPCKGAVLTITADNGKVFAYHELTQRQPN